MTPTPDIRDIRGPIAIPYWWLPLAYGLGAVAVLAAAYGIYRLVRRHRRERVKSAAEIALERIERARGLLDAASSAAFSAEVSDAIRVYIEAAFSLRAAHRTTEEFLRDLLGAEASPIAAHRASLEDFLSWCDLAKFARLTLGDDNARLIVEAARRFVEETRGPAEVKSSKAKRATRPPIPAREASRPQEAGT